MEETTETRGGETASCVDGLPAAWWSGLGRIGLPQLVWLLLPHGTWGQKNKAEAKELLHGSRLPVWPYMPTSVVTGNPFHHCAARRADWAAQLTGPQIAVMTAQCRAGETAGLSYCAVQSRHENGAAQCSQTSLRGSLTVQRTAQCRQLNLPGSLTALFSTTRLQVSLTAKCTPINMQGSLTALHSSKNCRTAQTGVHCRQGAPCQGDGWGPVKPGKHICVVYGRRHRKGTRYIPSPDLVPPILKPRDHDSSVIPWKAACECRAFRTCPTLKVTSIRRETLKPAQLLSESFITAPPAAQEDSVFNLSDASKRWHCQKSRALHERSNGMEEEHLPPAACGMR